MKVIEHRDGSFSFDDEGEGQPDVAEAFKLIAQHHLSRSQKDIDRAARNLRVAKVCRDGHGSALEQAKAEVAAEVATDNAKAAMRESDHWSRHLKRKPSGHKSGREIR